jgi:hypothetical protein
LTLAACGCGAWEAAFLPLVDFTLSRIAQIP